MERTWDRAKAVARRFFVIARGGHERDCWWLDPPGPSVREFTGKRCAYCGSAPVSRHLVAPRTVASGFQEPPVVRVGVCQRCGNAVGRQRRRDWLLAALMIALGMGPAALLYLVWPWAPLAVFVGMVSVAVAGGYVAVVWLDDRYAGNARNPALWDRHGGRARLRVEVEAVAEALCAAGWTAVASRARRRRPTVVRLAVVASVLGPVWLWQWWHPEVTVVNVTGKPLEIRVDDRPVALVLGTVREAPRMRQRVVLPRGWRRFEAWTMAGHVADAVRAYVGAGRVQLYAPAHQPRCLWVEQRAYGSVQPVAPRIDLEARQSFYTLADPIDGWFEPNPPVRPSRWYSGGVRRAVRQGRCDRGAE